MLEDLLDLDQKELEVILISLRERSNSLSKKIKEIQKQKVEVDNLIKKLEG